MLSVVSVKKATSSRYSEECLSIESGHSYEASTLTYFHFIVQHCFYLRGFVVAFAVDKGVADDAPVAVGLQGAFGDMECKAYFLPVHSLLAVGRVHSAGQACRTFAESLDKADEIQSRSLFDFDVVAHGLYGFWLNMSTKKYGDFATCKPCPLKSLFDLF